MFDQILVMLITATKIPLFPAETLYRGITSIKSAREIADEASELPFSWHMLGIRNAHAALRPRNVSDVFAYV